MNAQFFVSLHVMAIVLGLILLSTAYLILLERKVAAWSQDRIGPNRTGFSFGLDDVWRKVHLPVLSRFRFWGLGQALADGLKLMLKEDYIPPHVDRLLFILSPVLIVIPAMIGWAVMPVGGRYVFPGLDLPGWLPVFGGIRIESATVTVAGAPLTIGLIYVLAVSSLGVYGVVLGAYASNNKYSFLGGIRAVAQMLSYEIPMGLSVLIMILTFKTTNPDVLVNHQAGGIWGIALHPLIAVIFFISVLAECNRAPFDLPEAEQELVGGYHTEYSAMKWAMFFLAEYMHMITGSAFFCVLFLGGWDITPLARYMPVIPSLPVSGGLALVLVKFVVFAIKVAFLLFVMMWVRWTLPRFRFDQLMHLAWWLLIPMTLCVLLLSSVVVYLKMPLVMMSAVNVLVSAGFLIAAWGVVRGKRKVV